MRCFSTSKDYRGNMIRMASVRLLSMALGIEESSCWGTSHREWSPFWKIFSFLRSSATRFLKYSAYSSVALRCSSRMLMISLRMYLKKVLKFFSR